MRGAWEPVEVAVDLLERAEALDAPADAASNLIERLLPTGPARDLLHGVWLGHPLHPVLTDLPIGSWTSAMVLDVLGGRAGAGAARCLVGFGCLSALPTIASGAADWSRLDAEDQRVGLVHAAANSVALGLYTWSWLERRRGRRGRGVAISFVAAAAATAGGLLGGHLAFRRGVGSNRAVGIEPPSEWTEASPNASSLPGVDAIRVEGVDVLVDADVGAGIAARCSHAGGPLAEGTLEGGGRDRCVVCPWHDSAFRLSDGTVVHGPATSPQPAYEVRRSEGRWLARGAAGVEEHVSVRRRASETPPTELDDQDDREELRDRYYGLIQELRIVLPGVQILAAFMLTVPFAQRFAQVDSWGEAFFGVALCSAVLSVVCFMTPTVLHRFGPRTARGARLSCSITVTRIGIALLGVALLASLTVVTRFLFAPVVTGAMLGVTALAMIGLWIVMPARLRGDEAGEG